MRNYKIGDHISVTYTGRVIGVDSEGNTVVRAHSSDLAYMARTVRETDVTKKIEVKK